MCGFSGILCPGGGDFTQALSAMGDAIAHRGPDSHGIWDDKAAGIGFVHRRLAIVDISAAGHQPMTTASGRYILSYNGEIYNHLDIRAELAAITPDIQWRGHSDTETLLLAIEQWGFQAAVERLVGMFAISLWDRDTRTLHMARDRIGEKPVYYGWLGDRFLFGSELKALRAMPGFEAEIDRDALTLYFRHNYVPAPRSIYKGISKLEPGCVLSVSAESPTPAITRYWSPLDVTREQQEHPFTGSFTEATDEVERLLMQSIKGQMMADVPLGAFLSGGIDSSTVVALMQKQASTSVNTFSIGFDNPRFNEAHHARAIADALGTNHTELYLADSDIGQLIQTLPSITDEPFADSSLLPTYAVAKLARQSVTVSLSGDGGDELFGGYTRYRPAAKAIRYRHAAAGAGGMLARALKASPFMAHDVSGKLYWRPSVLSRLPGAAAVGSAVQVMSKPSDALGYRELVSYWRNPHTPVLNADDPHSYFHEPARWLDTGHIQEAVQMMDVQTYLPDDILVKVDRSAMNVSLETRVPMLDHRLLAFVWSLPASFRAQGTKKSTAPKPLLKDLACRHVPRDQIERPKMGFGIPIEAWLRGPLREWAEDLLNPATMREQGLLDVDLVHAQWNSFRDNQGAYPELVWSVLMLQHWLRGA